MTLKEKWRELHGKGLEPGVYKYDGKGDLKQHRFHLRVDSASQGSLLVDASSIIFLNGTAVDYVRCALEDRTAKAAARYMRRRYRGVERKHAAEHYLTIKSQLSSLIAGDHEVLSMMGPEKPTIGKDEFPAPYRMDLALTYRCQNKCDHCYNEPRELKELTVEQWKQVIAKTGSWASRTSSSPAVADDVRGAGGAGGQVRGVPRVTGMVTNGRMLARPGYLHDLVVKGLDHVQITVLSHARNCTTGWRAVQGRGRRPSKA